MGITLLLGACVEASVAFDGDDTDRIFYDRHAADFFSSIALSGSSLVRVSWPDRGAIRYELWASAEPDFAPGEPGSRLLQSSVDLSYLDAAGEETYYRVVAQGGSGGVSDIVGQIPQPLSPAFSKVGACLISEVDTWAELRAAMPSDPDLGASWNPQTQRWETHGGIPFALGSALSVRHPGTPSPGTYVMVGRVPAVDDVAIELLPGDNLVTTLPLPDRPTSASELFEIIDGVQRIGTWDAATQSIRWYPESGDFALSTCSPVHVEVETPSAWAPVRSFDCGDAATLADRVEACWVAAMDTCLEGEAPCIAAFEGCEALESCAAPSQSCASEAVACYMDALTVCPGEEGYCTLGVESCSNRRDVCLGIVRDDCQSYVDRCFLLSDLFCGWGANPCEEPQHCIAQQAYCDAQPSACRAEAEACFGGLVRHCEFASEYCAPERARCEALGQDCVDGPVTCETEVEECFAAVSSAYGLIACTELQRACAGTTIEACEGRVAACQADVQAACPAYPDLCAEALDRCADTDLCPDSCWWATDMCWLESATLCELDSPFCADARASCEEMSEACACTDDAHCRYRADYLCLIDPDRCDAYQAFCEQPAPRC